MATLKDAETRLRTACQERPYGCALARLYECVAGLKSDRFDQFAVDVGLCTKPQAWAIMSGWDGPRSPGDYRYVSLFDPFREADWYALGQRLRREFAPNT